MKLRYGKAMELAEKLAFFSQYPKYRLGAVITSKNHDLLSMGVNRHKTHPIQAKFKKERIFLHAEMDALTSCRGEPFHIYVVRVMADGTLGLAKPCEDCMSVLKRNKIKRIYWSI